MALKNFRTAYGKKLTQDLLLKEIKDFISADKRYKYRILVGTDSEVQENKIEFISVIVVHRVGYGARYFWRKTFVDKKMDLFTRLWEEANLSLEVSREILEALIKERLEFDFELHLDLSNNGKSKSVVKEIINLVKGYGFEVKIKPEAYAASKIADHLL